MDPVRHVRLDAVACRGHRRAARVGAQIRPAFEHRERRSHMGLDLGEQALLELGIARETELCNKANHGRIAHSRIARKPHYGAKPRGRIIRQQPTHYFELGACKVGAARDKHVANCRRQRRLPPLGGWRAGCRCHYSRG